MLVLQDRSNIIYQTQTQSQDTGTYNNIGISSSQDTSVDEIAQGELKSKEIAKTSDRDLLKAIWSICYFTWIPCFNLILSMSVLMDLFYRDQDIEDRHCPKIHVDNALIWIPIFIGPARLILETIYLLCRPRFDFENKVTIYLKLFFTLTILQLCMRQAIIICHVFVETSGATKRWLQYAELLLSCAMILAHSVMHIKLNMFVQMMGMSHRWQMMTAKGSAALTSAFLYALWLFINSLINRLAVDLVVVTLSNLLIILMCRRALKQTKTLSEHPQTIRLIDLYRRNLGSVVFTDSLF